MTHNHDSKQWPGADPELLLGGAPIPTGALPNILVIFSEKPYENKEILVRRGVRATDD